jgi:y4mF family transcriptional regulator
MYTPEDIGRLVRTTRTGLRLTQENLALASGTGLRFIVDLERGKPTCQLAKVLDVLRSLGIQMSLTSPDAAIRSTPTDRQERR